MKRKTEKSNMIKKASEYIRSREMGGKTATKVDRR